MLERDVKKSLKEYLTKIGAYQFWPVPTGFGATTVDCLFCHKGRFFGVETKRPGAKATIRQKITMNLIELAGGDACLEDSPALLAVKEMLGE